MSLLTLPVLRGTREKKQEGEFRIQATKLLGKEEEAGKRAVGDATFSNLRSLEYFCKVLTHSAEEKRKNGASIATDQY